NIPFNAIVCRGPASNDHVTLSLRPSGWQDAQPPQPRSDHGGRDVKKSIFPRRTVSATVPGGGNSADRTRCSTAWPLKFITMTSRVVGQSTYACNPLESMTIPRGLRPERCASLGSIVKMRATGLTGNGPGAVGALMLGTPCSSKVTRTMKSLPWLTTQHVGLPTPQSMSTGTEGNMRSVLSRIWAGCSPSGRSKLMPRFMFNADPLSWSVDVSKNDSRLCTSMLRRSGGSGDAPGPGAYTCVSWITMLANMLGHAPLGCATVPSVAPSAKIVRGASVADMFTKLPRAKLNPVSASGESVTAPTTALVAVATIS